MAIKEYLHKYVLRPYLLLRSALSIFVLVLLILLIDVASENVGSGGVALTSEWAYRTLPHLLESFASSRRLIVSFVVIYVLKSFLIPASSADVVRVYERNRIGAFNSAFSMPLSAYIWFAVAESAIYVSFGVIAVITYVLCYYSWITYGLQTTWLLWVTFVLLYPLLYCGLSISAFIAVLPFTNAKRISAIKYLLNGYALRQLYIFYFLRVGVETALALGVAIITLHFWSSIWLSTALIGIGMTIPIAVIKGASLEIKLKLLQGDPDIRRLFHQHYLEHPPRHPRV